MLRGLKTILMSLIFFAHWKFLVVSISSMEYPAFTSFLSYKLQIYNFCLELLGTLDEHMHLLLPALIRIFKANASVEVRCAAIRTLIRLIPRVQVEVRLIFFLA